MRRKSILALAFSLTILTATFTISNNVRARENALPPSNEWNFHVTATTSTSVSLAWNAVQDADKYIVQKWYGGEDWRDLATTTNTTYTDANLHCNETVQDIYKLVAIDTDTDPDTRDETGWIPGAPLNDDFANAVDVSNLENQTLSTCNANVSKIYDDPDVDDCGLGKGVATVWYEYDATSNTALSLDTFTSNYNTFIAVWSGTSSDYEGHSLTPVVCNNDASSDTNQSQVAFQVSQGTNYYIEVGQIYNADASALAFQHLTPPLEERMK